MRDLTRQGGGGKIGWARRRPGSPVGGAASLRRGSPSLVDTSNLPGLNLPPVAPTP